jgi:hypothetical protein
LAAANIPHDLADEKPVDAHHSIEEQTHGWSIPTFYWLAQQKQWLLRYAEENAYDALLLVDSDLLLDSRAIASLIHAEKPVVSGVFWTKWQPDAPMLPQVWLQHPYGFEAAGQTAEEFLGKLRRRELVPVQGLGAFTLIRAGVFSQLSFDLVPDLPQEGMWQGEDRHFCVRANRNHVELWADAWPHIFHAYRPSDIDLIPHALEALAPRIVEPPHSPASWVSLTLEPMEEPALTGFSLPLRGRLGLLRLLPELEEAVAEMTPDTERILPVTFPLDWPVEGYRGQTRIVRIRLHDTREI